MFFCRSLQDRLRVAGGELLEPASKSASTLSIFGAFTGPWAYSAPSMNGLSFGNSAVYGVLGRLAATA